ncbi:MAG TPA: acetyl-CoA carboxylase biotin carboxyl carrier protein [Tepidisphaeraceae bacterium]
MSEKQKNKKRPTAPAPAAATGSPMDVRLLSQIVELMAAADLNTVDVRDGDRRVILKRGAVTGPVQIMAAPQAAPQPAAPRAAGTSPVEAAPVDSDAGLTRISSPMVGTFYAAAKPGEKPFVSVGSRVGDDTDVCIIEAMKTFNNIKAECNGTIARVLVQDGQPVEFGTVLFLVKPG